MTLPARQGSPRKPQVPDRIGPRLPSLSLLQLLILLVGIAAIILIWIATLQRATFERAQAVAAAIRSNANLAIALEQQATRTRKEAEQIAVFGRHQSLHEGPSPVNYADRDFFTQQRDNPQDTLYLDHPVLGRISNQWRIPMSLRITRPDGGFGGVVVLSVDPANLATLYGGIRPGPSDMLEI